MTRVIEIMVPLLCGLAAGLWTTWLLRNTALYHRIHGRHKPTAKLPEFLPILEEMVRAWNRLTDEDINRAGIHLRPAEKSDTRLGVIHSLAVRRTWALGVYLRTQRDQAKLLAGAQAGSVEEVRFHMEQSRRFDILDDCAQELFWAQAREDVGAWAEPAVGVRAGWLLVAQKPPGPQSFIEMLGGHLPGGGA